MKKTILTITLIAAIITASLVACSDGSATQTEPIAVISNDSLVRRGEYLVNGMGCDDCHTQHIMGPQGPALDIEHRFAGFVPGTPVGKADLSVMKEGYVLFGMSGTVYVGPWGTSYAANISSDATGIGNWSEEQFLNAIRNGKSKGINEGRGLMPPMPWEIYRNLSDVDLKSIFAYLKTTKPVENRVPGPKAPGL